MILAWTGLKSWLDGAQMWLDITGPQIFAGVVEFLAARVPAEQLVFGSDMPFLDLGTRLRPVVHARMSD